MITVVSWNYNSGNRHFAKSEIDVLYKHNLVDRLITKDYKIYDSEKNIIRSRNFYIFRVLRLLTKILINLKILKNKKYLKEWLFDTFAAWNIGTSEYLYTDKNNFYKTLKKAKRKRIKTISYQAMPHYSSINEILSKEIKKYNINSKFINYKLSKRREKGLIFSDYIIAHSELVKNTDLESGLNDKSYKICYGSVDTEYYKPIDKSNNNSFTVLFVGNDALLKGTLYLLEAWALALEKGVKGQIVLVGDIDQEIKAKYTNQNILFKGSLKTEEVKNLYQQADIFVQPSLIDAGPKTTTEALACGLPVIISDGCGYSEIIEEEINGFIVPKRNSEEIAQKIHYAYEQKGKKLENMKIQARKKAEEFSITKHQKQFIEIINSIIANEKKQNLPG